MTGGATACPRCGTDNAPGAKFCIECGSALSTSCPECGTATTPGQNFCSECGAALSPRSASAQVAATPRSESVAVAAGANRRDSAELKTVSVLFVDLVSYTALSEVLDPEDVRDMLGHYFDAARRIVDRYGGTVEKFIGDAVMAVWGTPVAREDDAERAVRAALELVDVVGALREEVGAPPLQARAGVVTGQAALLANPGEGVVVGDRVNTAARVQAAAEPGTVLVDDVTRQVTSATIVYEDAGSHELKGKTNPVHLWRATEVAATAAGADGHGLHARFVGRDADLRLAIELLHAGVARQTVRLIAVWGPAGVGKTRLRFECLNYVMNLPERFELHLGRCLPYGDGVAYWALAEMVRARLGLAEDALPEETAAKLETGLERWVIDERERQFISQRLGVLLGVAEPGLSREELFAGWRLFFERLSEHAPVVMAFEDMHWAEDGLLDFLEYLLEWSSQHPIFIVTLARPELSERRPGWPAGHRNATALYLEPLGDGAMEELLDSVATLPDTAKRRIISHAEGIPLYAIETVRMLTDRGALVERDGALVLVGELGELDVPASLISLLGARLDALAPEERELVKSMSVFAGSFPLAAVQALSGLPARSAETVLTSLVRKHVLTVRADPLAPDRGQYRFAQTLLRTVAYEMLSKRERKARHLAAGQYLSRAFANEGEDVAEVVAAHYFQAYRCAANDADADLLRTEAVNALRRGAQRAAAVGAPQAAESGYRRAIELAVDDAQRIELTVSAAEMALVDGRYERALDLYEAAVSAMGEVGRSRDAARLGAPIGQALRRAGRTSEAIERMRRDLAVLSDQAGDPEAAQMNVELGVALLSAGRVAEASDPIERALELAQALELPAVLVGALTYKAQLCDAGGRAHEARILFDAAIELCERYEQPDRLFVAQLNGGDFLTRFDLPGAAERTAAALGTARRIGSRFFESVAASNVMRVWEYTGAWDELERLGRELLEGQSRERPGAELLHFALGIVAAFRGEAESARAHLFGIDAWQHNESNQLRFTHAACQATIALARGDANSAFELLAGRIGQIVEDEGPASQASRIAFPTAVEAALELGRPEEAAEVLALLADRPPGHVPPFLRAQVARGRGLVLAAEGDTAEAQIHLGAAIDAFGSLGYPYWLARAQGELARVLVTAGRVAEARRPLEAAIAALATLGAAPALAQARSLAAGLPVTATRT